MDKFSNVISKTLVGEQRCNSQKNQNLQINFRGLQNFFSIILINILNILFLLDLL